MRGNSNSRVSETVQNKGFCKVGNGLLLMVLSEGGRDGGRGRRERGREGERARERERGRGRVGERERRKGEERVKFSDIFCVDICIRCDQSTDTLTVAIP